MNINIDTIGNVFYNHSKIANVRQTQDYTRVIDRGGANVTMPKVRYNLVNAPQDFYADLLAVINPALLA